MQLTSADHLALDVPLAQDGKEEGEGIDNGDGKAELWG
jgi:hypothetical protein